MKHLLTTTLARQEQAAAKAKARAEAEVIARETARKKKAEHDAMVPQAAIWSPSRERPLRSGRKPCAILSNRS